MGIPAHELDSTWVESELNNETERLYHLCEPIIAVVDRRNQLCRSMRWLLWHIQIHPFKPSREKKTEGCVSLHSCLFFLVLHITIHFTFVFAAAATFLFFRRLFPFFLLIDQMATSTNGDSHQARSTVGLLLIVGDIISNEQRDEILQHLEQALRHVDTEKFDDITDFFNDLIQTNEFHAGGCR